MDYTFLRGACIIPYWSLESITNPHHLPTDKYSKAKTQLALNGWKEKKKSFFQTISICMLDIMSQWTVCPSLVRWALCFGRCSERLYPHWLKPATESTIPLVSRHGAQACLIFETLFVLLQLHCKPYEKGALMSEWQEDEEWQRKTTVEKKMITDWITRKRFIRIIGHFKL